MSNVDIIARLKLNATNFTTELNSSLGQVEKKFGSTGSVIGRNLSDGIGGGLQDVASCIPLVGGALAGLSGAALVATAGIGAVSLAFAHGLAEAEGFEEAVRGVDAVLRATGNTTGYTRDELVGFANDLEGVIAVPAEEILKAEQVLSSFGGVSGDVFQRAIKDAGDLAAVYGGDITSNAEKLGTVLQNLAQGEVTGLSKGFKFLGVETLDAIEQLAKTGQTAKAQESLLAALESRVGGAGEAKSQGLSGAFFRFSDAMGDASRQIAKDSGLYDELLTRINALTWAAEKFGGAVQWAFGTTPNVDGMIEEMDRRLALSGVTSVDQMVSARSANNAYTSAEAQRRQEKAREDAKRAAEKAERLADAAAKREDAEATAATARMIAEGQRAAAADTISVKSQRFLDEVARPLGTTVVDEVGKRFMAERDAQIAELRDQGIQAVEAIADQFEVQIGGRIGRIAGDLFSLSAGGRANDPLMRLLGGQGGKGLLDPASIKAGFGEVFDPLTDVLGDLGTRLTGTLGLDGTFSQVVGRMAAGSMIGGQAAGLLSSSKASALGGSIGGAIGTELGKQVLGKALGQLGGAAGPLGAIAGGLLGSVAGGLFSSVKKGSATLGFTGDGTIGAVSTSGNSASRISAAKSGAGTIGDKLAQIADLLGGDLGGSISTSIGIRKDSYRVDTTGQGRTKGAGVLDFGKDEAAAIEAAIADALSDGVITGISDAAKRILASGKDLDKAIQQAIDIESIPRQLKQLTDPMGAALDALDEKTQKLIATLNEAGGTSEQMADLEKLYALQRADVIKQYGDTATKTLRDYLADLQGSDVYSLSEQERVAMAALQPYLDKIDRGTFTSDDQQAYVAAADKYREIERELYAGTERYFATIDNLQAYTNKAIGTIDTITPIRDDTTPFVKSTASATAATASATQAMADMLSDQTALLTSIQSLLASGGGGSVSLFADGRSFVA